MAPLRQNRKQRKNPVEIVARSVADAPRQPSKQQVLFDG